MMGQTTDQLWVSIRRFCKFNCFKIPAPLASSAEGRSWGSGLGCRSLLLDRCEGVAIRAVTSTIEMLMLLDSLHRYDMCMYKNISVCVRIFIRFYTDLDRTRDIDNGRILSLVVRWSTYRSFPLNSVAHLSSLGNKFAHACCFRALQGNRPPPPLARYAFQKSSKLVWSLLGRWFSWLYPKCALCLTG